jgi:sarcosine oxidase subunit gamma
VGSPLGDVLALGPDEWLVVGPDGTEGTIERALRAAAGADGAVVDLSSSGAGLLLCGPAARAVLATCCALDFHPRAFGPGQCAATLLAKAPMIIHQLDLTPSYRILVRPSLAEYLAGWLLEGLAAVRVAGR